MKIKNEVVARCIGCVSFDYSYTVQKSICKRYNKCLNTKLERLPECNGKEIENG